MKCDLARAAVSERMDGVDTLDAPPSSALETHLTSCRACADFERIALQTRRALRFDLPPVDDDLTERVLDEIAHPAGPRRRATPPRGRRLLAAAAVFALCAAGAFVVTRASDGVAPALADDRADLVTQGQTRVRSLHASLALYERTAAGAAGTHADGDLTYVAPEGVLLRLDGPAGPIEVGVNGDAAWRHGAVDASVRGREPFDAAGWSALEIVVPVDAFGRDEAGTSSASLDGQPVEVVTTTAGQVDELLAALRTGIAWRPLHPSDVVTLWLDAETAVPRQIEVTASADPDRAAWAARLGLREPVEGALFVAQLRDLEVDAGEVPAVAPPAADASRDLGFVDRTVTAAELPDPAWLPDGMAPYRSGERTSSAAAEPVVVRTWTNGRAWIKLVGTRSWARDQLFGLDGAPVRPLTADVGTVYVAEDATSIALHSDGMDLMITGSVGEATLLEVLASTGVQGEVVPAWWAEAGSTTADELTRSGRAALVPVIGGEFSGASVTISATDGRIDVAIVGPGARGARLVELEGQGAAPAEDPDARIEEVRSIAGRYSPTLGELAWVERGQRMVLSSSTLTAQELVALAEQLRWTVG